MPDFERLKRLGSGNFGEVWLVFDKALGVRRAVKYVDPSRIHDPTNFYQEPKTLMALRHENIVRVEDAGILSSGALYISMEYLRRGSIDSKYKGAPVPLSRSLAMLQDVCWGLEYAHEKGYIHRDTKPANILIGDLNKAKLSDFGLAVKVPRGASASPYGYLTHVAPEVFSTGSTTVQSDIYALGVTAYRIVNGDGFLPEISDTGEIQDAIISGDYPNRNHYRPFIPTRLKRVINRCMAVDPSERYGSAAEFRKALEKIHVHCDWKWKRVRKRIEYATLIGANRILVTVEELPSGRFSIATRKSSQSGTIRRVMRDCENELPLSRMKVRIRSILSRYVEKGR